MDRKSDWEQATVGTILLGKWYIDIVLEIGPDTVRVLFWHVDHAADR